MVVGGHSLVLQLCESAFIRATSKVLHEFRVVSCFGLLQLFGDLDTNELCHTKNSCSNGARKFDDLIHIEPLDTHVGQLEPDLLRVVFVVSDLFVDVHDDLRDDGFASFKGVQEFIIIPFSELFDFIVKNEIELVFAVKIIDFCPESFVIFIVFLDLIDNLVELFEIIFKLIYIIASHISSIAGLERCDVPAQDEPTEIIGEVDKLLLVILGFLSVLFLFGSQRRTSYNILGCNLCQQWCQLTIDGCLDLLAQQVPVILN